MPSHSPPNLIASDIGVRFGGLVALSGVSLEIGEGEIVGLIGANGAGKSTLINVLSGFQRPSEGDVFLGAKRLSGMKPNRLARTGVVRTFQAVRLFSELSVIDNISAAAAVLGKNGPDPTMLLRLLGLEEQRDQPADSLPYADQRRLAIARALALDPKFLLLDEPAAGMSPEEISDLGATLLSLRDRSQIGLLLVEHNMELVMSICERLVVLNVGKVIARGTPAEVRGNPAVRDAYLGTLEKPSHAAS